MRFGEIYDLESFENLLESNDTSGFTDSEAGVVLARNLTAINRKIFEKRYPELAFLNSGIKADNTGGWATRIQSLRIKDEGDFVDASDISSNKGRIALSAEDSVLKVFPKEAHSVWSDDEIKGAQLQNINLIERYIATHTKLYNQKIDEIGFLGHNGQEGLLNYAGFGSEIATKTIDQMTSDEMYDTISHLITNQRNGVNNTPEYSCDTVVMPIKVLNKLQVEMLNTAAGSSTVLKALKDNFPDISFVSSFRANDVGGSGKIVAYSTSEEAMVMRIPIKLTIGEIVKQTSFNYRIDSKFRIAGLDVLEESSARVLAGI